MTLTQKQWVSRYNEIVEKNRELIKNNNSQEAEISNLIKEIEILKIDIYLSNQKVEKQKKKYSELAQTNLALTEDNNDYRNNMEPFIKTITFNDSEIQKTLSLYADAATIYFEKFAVSKEVKKHPVYKKAENVRDYRNIAKEHEKRYKELIYKHEILLYSFPELGKYMFSFDDMSRLSKFEGIQELKEEYDYSRDYLSKEDYESLGEVDRNQLALDTYIKKGKTKWQVGRDYEMFVGQYLEKKGFIIDYFGIKEKLNDLGRDLIAKSKGIVKVVQCKYRDTKKGFDIHENTIAQLYGTTEVFKIESKSLFPDKYIHYLFSIINYQRQLKDLQIG